jgi:hypothetical protein
LEVPWGPLQVRQLVLLSAVVPALLLEKLLSTKSNYAPRRSTGRGKLTPAYWLLRKLNVSL